MSSRLKNCEITGSAVALRRSSLIGIADLVRELCAFGDVVVSLALIPVVNFQLDQLGWKAFQQLSHTVLRELLGQTIEAFLDNNDGGRDGAFTGVWTPSAHEGSTLSGQFVVQCKHTTRPSHNLSLSELSDELAKAERLVSEGLCDSYILMTNAGITGATAAQLSQRFTDMGVASRVFGATWFNQVLSENARLRRLVPRLYGLGDLTMILDERAYAQAHAVLNSMRSDLERLVLTRTYSKAADALDHHGFVLLTGGPATGKTTIAAQLVVGAADEFGTSVVKLDGLGSLEERWNPNEPQLFWVDDAFGATQFVTSLAYDWVKAVPRIRGAIQSGSKFIVTSRDYVYRAARPKLKLGSFPRLNEAEVVVDVSELTIDEREQILYNHLRHGEQPVEFIAAITPHLENAARHSGFTPELARRLSEPSLTSGLRPSSWDSVNDYLSRPADFLHEVMDGLDAAQQAALGLIFIHQGWLPSPIPQSNQVSDFLVRMDSTIGAATRALGELDGTLAKSVQDGSKVGWEFAHPTMTDAFGRILQTPEHFPYFVSGFPLDVLLTTVTCGDVGLEGAIVLSPSAWPGLLARFDEPAGTGGQAWRARDRRYSFLANRCGREFLALWAEANSDVIGGLGSADLMLSACSSNYLAARLHEFGLLPPETRDSFAADLVDLGVTGQDFEAMWDPELAGVLTDQERERLKWGVRKLIGDPVAAIRALTYHVYFSGDPEDQVGPLRDLHANASEIFGSSSDLETELAALELAVDSWVAENRGTIDDSVFERRSELHAPAHHDGGADRSTFDDLVEGFGPE